MALEDDMVRVLSESSDAGGGLQVRYGTATSASEVRPDGAYGPGLSDFPPVPVVRCVQIASGDRVVMLVDGNVWIAIGVVI